MKHYLWILNSWLVVLFFLATGIGSLLKQLPPKLAVKSAFEEPVKKKTAITINLEKIYQNDLFDTLIIKDAEPTKKSLVTPIPELKSPTLTPIPEVQKPQFLPPLSVALKGIILSSDDQESVAMVSDETNKESLYHVGDRVKDGQIIKIARNRVILLRSNGQQEVLYLRKEDNELAKPPVEKWKLTVKKIDEVTYEIDPNEIKRDISSLGELMDQLKLSTSYKAGKAIGIKVGFVDPNEFGAMIGLQKNDIITSIYNIETADVKNRLDIFDKLKSLPLESSVKVELLRNNAPTVLNYTLKKIEPAIKKVFDGQDAAQAGQAHQEGEGSLFKLSSLQEREQSLREFEKTHPSTHDETVLDLRKRLLENMKSRSQNMRVR